MQNAVKNGRRGQRNPTPKRNAVLRAQGGIFNTQGTPGGWLGAGWSSVGILSLSCVGQFVSRFPDCANILMAMSHLPGMQIRRVPYAIRSRTALPFDAPLTVPWQKGPLARASLRMATHPALCADEKLPFVDYRRSTESAAAIQREMQRVLRDSRASSEVPPQLLVS